MEEDIDGRGNQKVIRLVVTGGSSRSYELANGTFQERVGETASWRHNNQGNSKFEYAHSADTTVHASRTMDRALHDAKQYYEAVVDLDQRGNIIFDTCDHGRAAQENFISNARNMKKMLLYCRAITRLFRVHASPGARPWLSD